jgi:hypothetical protein
MWQSSASGAAAHKPHLSPRRLIYQNPCAVRNPHVMPITIRMEK